MKAFSMHLRLYAFVLFSHCLLCCSARPSSNASVTAGALAPSAAANTAVRTVPTAPMEVPSASLPSPVTSPKMPQGETVPPQSRAALPQSNETLPSQSVESSADDRADVEREPHSSAMEQRGFGPEAGADAPFGMVNLTKPPSKPRGSKQSRKSRK